MRHLTFCMNSLFNELLSLFTSFVAEPRLAQALLGYRVKLELFMNKLDSIKLLFIPKKKKLNTTVNTNHQKTKFNYNGCYHQLNCFLLDFRKHEHKEFGVKWLKMHNQANLCSVHLQVPFTIDFKTTTMQNIKSI